MLVSRTLQSGLRLQCVHLPESNVVTVMILVGAGSRYETKENTGISHFLEHMFFKGAKRYPTPQAVAEAVDSFGGEFNAFTGKEYAGYFITCSGRSVGKAVEVLSDMLLHSTMQTPEVERERGVILQEMAMYEDAPMYQISWDFEQLLYGDQPLGWDQIGSKAVVGGMTREQLLHYREALYTPDNMVLCIAGGTPPEEALSLLEESFPLEQRPATLQPTRYNPALSTKKLLLRHKKTEQYHLAFGVRGYAETDPRYTAQEVLSVILGGNMSSRMFQRIREQRSLCYSIHTQSDEYTDTSLLCTTVGVAPERAMEAIAAVRDEYAAVVESGITAAELTKARSYLLGTLDLKRDQPYNNAHRYSAYMLLYGTVQTWEDYAAKIDAVTQQDVEAVARELLTPEAYRLAGIGKALEEDAVGALLA
ncbi:insulinase family protein [Candidatus Peribacteria bacterium]|nr:insulinase family protein [Candidatus Peribacteria bacterium]